MNLKSGISIITKFDVFDVTSLKIAGCVPRGENSGDYNSDNVMPIKEQRKAFDFILYGLEAATQAINDAGISKLPDEASFRTGVIIGSGIAGLTRYPTILKSLKKKALEEYHLFIPSSSY